MLEDYPDDPTYRELVGALAALNVDQMEELLAIVWIGRGDDQKEEWRDALAVAGDSRDEHAPRYLARTPLVAAYIKDGLDALGYPARGYRGRPSLMLWLMGTGRWQC